MEKFEYQEKDGKVFCPLANKWLVAKPEEKVRQKYICILVNDYGYSLDQMAQEQKVNNSQRGQGKARADIVIWKSKKDKDDRKAAFIVVECKAENVKIRVEDYYQGFNYAAWAHADFFVTTNEKETKFFNVDPAFLPQKLEEVIAIPSIHELQTESLFGLSVKASLEQKKEMIPVLRMSNVVNGEIDYSELKYLPLKCATTNKEPDKWLLRNGDFLITRTNGSKDLVGKAAVFHGKDVYTYASYLIRYRFDISIVLPEYVNILFMTQLVREQIAVMRRQGGGQYNLNSDEIGAIRIPVPSIPEQQAIVAAYDSAKDGANIYYDKGQTLKEKAAADFEKCIFA